MIKNVKRITNKHRKVHRKVQLKNCKVGDHVLIVYRTGKDIWKVTGIDSHYIHGIDFNSQEWKIGPEAIAKKFPVSKHPEYYI